MNAGAQFDDSTKHCETFVQFSFAGHVAARRLCWRPIRQTNSGRHRTAGLKSVALLVMLNSPEFDCFCSKIVNSLTAQSGRQTFPAANARSVLGNRCCQTTIKLGEIHCLFHRNHRLKGGLVEATAICHSLSTLTAARSRPPFHFNRSISEFD